MNHIALASTWRPHGENARLRALAPRLIANYSDICVALIDGSDEERQVLQTIPNIHLVEDVPRGLGRYAAITAALDTQATHLHYADMDRLLHWVETNGTEWEQVVERVAQADCLILGRTPHAFATHPHTLQETEKIINLVCSHLIQQMVDVGGGSRGFSRRAAEYLLQHSEPTWWGDASWPILLQRAGFVITYQEVDGLDWETGDRHQAAAADPETQRQRAAQIDADAKRWAMRVRVAQEIIAEGLAAYDLSLS